MLCILRQHSQVLLRHTQGNAGVALHCTGASQLPQTSCSGITPRSEAKISDAGGGPSTGCNQGAVHQHGMMHGYQPMPPPSGQYAQVR